MKNKALYLLIAITYWVMIIACLPIPYNSTVITTFKAQYMTITNDSSTSIDISVNKADFTFSTK